MERDIPCRVSADLAAYDRKQREDAMNAISFDEFDDDHVKAVANERLAKPVQALLLTLRQIKQTRDSFGADPKLCMDALMPDLEALREACIDIFKDL